MITFNLNVNKHNRGGGFSEDSTILIHIDQAMEDFYDWLDRNRSRIESLCTQYGWMYDISYSNQIVEIYKSK